MDLPWLTAEMHHLILLTFANVFWLIHFSFTNTRLINIEENRKLLAFGYPSRKLAWHLNLMSLYHPVNVIYNFTWLVFLGLQIHSGINIPLMVAALLLNYGLIYSVKQRFLRLMEQRFRLIIGSGLFIFFGVILAVAIISRDPEAILGPLAIQLSQVMNVLYWLPGGILYQTATYPFIFTEAAAIMLAVLAATWVIFLDHYRLTRSGLQNPSARKSGNRQFSSLWAFLKRWLGPNAGKYLYYVIIHPYNKLQLVAILIIPLVYIPILLFMDFGVITQVLVLTMLAAIPVALLAMGMANMFGYEHREMLLHLQFPVSLKHQLQERFLGVITLPIIIFFVITVLEIIYLPQLGTVYGIYIANTFFFLCFMLFFMWSSFYQYQTAQYSTFSYKHPIVPQKVTFTISLMIFILGYAVFIPLGDWQIHRLWFMGALIGIICVYLMANIELLANAFRKKILLQLWNDF
ncbi:hypothetical protein DYD21_02465 [Rhodohalobacter sp. SW132]|nr:hypothetical protein DYD21_02465 [Rhodohalobacter sp. SW132]